MNWFAVRCGLLLLTLPSLAQSAELPTRQQVTAALASATQFMAGKVADHGGYKWVSSETGHLGQGEGVAPPGTIWVQPPGTPAVGLAFMKAYRATGDPIHLKAAEAAAQALVQGQLRSGGWYYRIEFLPEQRKEFVYLVDLPADQTQPPATPFPGGWEIWRQRKIKGDMTILDDDTTPAALRLLMEVDRALNFKNKPIHEAVMYGLQSTLHAQYPIGAWSHNYDRYQTKPPAVEHYPIIAASFPENWSRTWTKDFNGCYMLNDRITQNMISTMLLAYEIYGNQEYLHSAEQGGQFLLLAQLPDPQPAWAQEYNRQMQPVWDRAFEPPAITGLESQDVLETLLALYRKTGNRKYLTPFPKALSYLKASELPNGKMARFYEFKTNRPIYFSKEYRITYDPKDSPDHYGFEFPSRLKSIEAEYERLLRLEKDALDVPLHPETLSELAKKASGILGAQLSSGGWLEPGFVRDANGKKTTPPQGVVHSQTYIEHIHALCAYLSALAE